MRVKRALMLNPMTLLYGGSLLLAVGLMSACGGAASTGGPPGEAAGTEDPPDDGTPLSVGSSRAKPLAGAIVYNEPSFFQNIEGQVVSKINPDDPSQKQLIPLVPRVLLSAEHPVFSRDGQLIAAVGLLQGTSTSLQGGYAVVVFDPNGANVQRVAPLGTAFGRKAYVAFSPDKTKVAYVDGSANWSDFYVVDRRLGSRVLIHSYSSGESDYTGTGIDWSPTADELISPIGIAANMCHPGALPVVVTALVQSRLVGNRISEWHLLTCPPVVLQGDLYGSIGSKADDVHPVFSRDGKHVAFVRWITQISGVLGSNQVTSSIRVVDLTNGAEREVVSMPGVRVCGLSWSGDGKSLAFDESRDINGVPTCGNLGLWIVGLNGSGLRQLLRTTASSPSWSWAP